MLGGASESHQGQSPAVRQVQNQATHPGGWPKRSRERPPAQPGTWHRAEVARQHGVLAQMHQGGHPGGGGLLALVCGLVAVAAGCGGTGGAGLAHVEAEVSLDTSPETGLPFSAPARAWTATCPFTGMRLREGRSLPLAARGWGLFLWPTGRGRAAELSVWGSETGWKSGLG